MGRLIMSYEVVILRAGYAGFTAALRLARQLYPDVVAITLINGNDRFVERPRLHQVATGQRVRELPLEGQRYAFAAQDCSARAV